MTPDQEAALAAAGFTPEQIAQMKAALVTTASDAPPAPPQVPPTNPTMSDDDKGKGGLGGMLGFSSKFRKMADMETDPAKKQMYAQFADEDEKKEKEFSEMKKRFSEFAAFADEQQKKTAAESEAQMSAEVERECAKLVRKVEPRVLATVVKPTALGILKSAHFSSAAEKHKTFSDYIGGFAALPDDPRLASAPGKAAGAPSALSAAGLKVLGASRDLNPRVYERLTAPTS